MKNTLCLVVATVAVLAVSLRTGHAADVWNRPGPYVGLGAAGGLEEFDERVGGNFGDSAGFNFQAGYRFTEFFALEGLYEYMDEFGHTEHFLPDLTAETDIRTHNFSVMGKGILPFGPVQPYIKGGVGFLNADVDTRLKGLGQKVHDGGSDTEFAGRVDGGIDLMATPNLSLQLDAGYVLPTEDLSDLNYISVSLGVRYIF
jgi:opacity protein-like surface antigen